MLADLVRLLRPPRELLQSLANEIPPSPPPPEPLPAEPRRTEIGTIFF
jgi:hypothetical protein